MINVVTSGLDALDGYFSKYLPQLGLAVTVPFLVGGAILLTDWQSAIIVAFTLPLIPIFMALIGWTTEAATKKSFAVADRLANHFADLIEGLPTLQAFARARAQRRGGTGRGEVPQRNHAGAVRILPVRPGPGTPRFPVGGGGRGHRRLPTGLRRHRLRGSPCSS